MMLLSRFRRQKEGASALSSLRIESLRLVWLEAFLKVAEFGGISAAADALGVDQSTVSRYMIALEKWAGEVLLHLDANEGAKTGRMVRITDAGMDLVAIAQEFVPRLMAVRSKDARREELLGSMDGMIAKMLADLNSKRPSQIAQSVREKVLAQADALAALRKGATWEVIEPFWTHLRRFFATYEDQLKRERKVARGKAKRTSAAHIDMSRYRKSPPAT